MSLKRDLNKSPPSDPKINQEGSSKIGNPSVLYQLPVLELTLLTT